MFETAELGRTLDKARYERRVPALRTELLALQERAREARLPIHILINGVDGAGKGETVNLLHEWMDPRYLSAQAFGPCSDEERSRPAWWRYWRALAPKGRIGIYFGNWYTEPIVGRALRHLSREGFEAQLTRIASVERALVDDGALIIKLWFHLSKKAQKDAYRALLASKRTRWRVTKDDQKNQRRYDRFREVSERAVRETSTGYAPWSIIEAGDERYRNVAVGETIAAALRERLDHPPPARLLAEQRPPPTDGRTILDTVKLSAKVPARRYDKRLERLQGRLHAAFDELKRERRSVIAVFEGWDAAGKGGAVRRVTAALDARDYRVIPIAAPTDEERAQHYLWRFWRHLPGAGRMTVYDRSWYGRVLVERVESFAREDEWQRAYNEINDFEAQLVEHGTVLAKFWLHIDQTEQLRRFKEREHTAFKKFKITEEDYRNRAKAGRYVHAVHDMIERTSTDLAPWHLVAATDKRFARLDVLEHLCARIEQAL